MTFASWARGALALAMALFFAAQGAALHAQGAGAHGAGTFAETCERPGAAIAGGESRAPATGAQHDCGACLACVVSFAAEARLDFHVAPVIASRVVLPVPDLIATPPVRWRAAHPARAPPRFS